MARGLPTNRQVRVHFSRPSNLDLLSALRRFVSGKKYNDVVLEIGDPSGALPLFFTVQKQGANFSYKSDFLSHNTVIESYEVSIAPLQYHGIWYFMLKSMGGDLTLTAAVINAYRTLIKPKSWFSEPKTNIGSELGSRISLLAGLSAPTNIYKVTPQALNELMVLACNSSYAVRRIN